MHKYSKGLKLMLLAGATAFGMIGNANAASVALFADTAYVDYTPPSTSSEAYNMQVALTSFGNTVSTFTGLSAAAWTAALAGKQVLVIPEQERGSIAATPLPAATITAIQNFVNGGGTLIVADDYSNTFFLNAVFGYSIVRDGTGAVSTKTAAATGTVFAGGPATLPNNDATDGGSVTASLPAGAVCAYAAGTQCMVYQITRGAGKIYYFAWDFYDAAPNGTQDGGWLAVLRPAAAGGGGGPQYIPAVDPVGIWLLGLLLAGLGVFALRRGLMH
jgi:hypothetical protein